MRRGQCSAGRPLLILTLALAFTTTALSQAWVSNEEGAKPGQSICSEGYVGEHMTQSADDSDTAIGDFRKTGSIEDLDCAITSLRSLSFSSASRAEWNKPNDEVARLWLRLFSAVDSTLAAKATNLRMPKLRVLAFTDDARTIPAGYPAGVSAPEIKKPDIRKRYEEDVAKNKRLLESSNSYYRIKYLDGKAHAYFQTWAYSRYRNNKSAQEQILDDATKLKLEPARIKSLRQEIGQAR